MSSPHQYDLIVLGGGCSGLALGCALAALQTDQKVLIVEARASYEDDRSWCFWERDDHRLADIVSQRWRLWAYSKLDQPMRQHQLPGYSYQYIRSIDYYNTCLDTIDRSKHIRISLGQAVQALTQDGNHWLVTTPTETYRARHVLDTRTPSRQAIDQALLLQCFVGVEIDLGDTTTLDTSTAEIMTHMRTVDGEFCFEYVLPLAPNRVLAEVTFFARHRMAEPYLSDQLQQMLGRRGWSSAPVLRREYGVLPMGLPFPKVAQSGQAMVAGMAAGALRPSSGYGFLRIQAWAQACAEQFHASGGLIAQTTSSPIIKHMDSLFLKALRRQPALAPTLFDAMLSRVPPERFIRFMNDNANWLDCFTVMTSLPTVPFIKALVTARS